jgi:hypothetical protein
MSDPVIQYGLPGMFSLAAVGLAVLARSAFGKTRNWREQGVTVEGEVIGFVERELPGRESLEARDEREPKFSPVLSFTAVDGIAHRVTASAAEPRGAYTVGQKLLVRYLPDAPDKADLESMAVSNMPGLALSILAVSAGSVALLVFLGMR